MIFVKKTLALFSALWLMLLCAGCKGEKVSLPEVLGVTLTDSNPVEYWDNHGAMSDGVSYWKVELSQKDADALGERAQTGEGWHPLPVNEDMETLLYGRQWQEGTESFGSGPYLTDKDGQPLLPQVKEGYWFFYDDQTETYETAGVTERASLNITAAVYDSQTRTLTCGKLDT